MARYKSKKIDFKKVVSAILVCVLLIASFGLVSSLVKNDMKTISPTVFEIGALDDNGKMMKSTTALYTEDFIECQGLTVDVGYDDTVRYKVFYYRDDKSFIGSTAELFGSYEKGNSYLNAKYARIVMFPELKEGDEKLTFLNKYGYFNDITIRVLKDQSFEAPLVSLDEDVRERYKSVGTDEDGNNVDVGYFATINAWGPYILEDSAEQSGKIIRKISVPVAGVSDHTKDSVFSVYVLSGNSTSGFKKVQEYECLIPAYTFTSSLSDYTLENNSVLNGANAVWYEFEVNIKLEEGQFLGFSDAKDSVSWIYRKPANSGDTWVNHYNFYGDAFKVVNENVVYNNQKSIYFEIFYLE